MRYYIEAFRGDRQLLGNGSLQNALGALSYPLRSMGWRLVLRRTTPEPWKGADRWRLVDETGKVLAEHSVQVAP